MHTLQTLQGWTGGLLYGAAGDRIAVRQIAIDTRRISGGEDPLFVALLSPRRNGHQFVQAAYEKGVRAFLVSEKTDDSPYPDVAFLQVTDTVQALQQIAAAHRQLFDIPVIGITGSNGKTVVKEWIFHCLEGWKTVVRSPKSYNSQIGVPLSVWQLNGDAEIAVFEAGISRPGEMEKLQRIIRPTIGLFTNIGPAHSEGFKNREEKIREKLILFEDAETLIYCADHAAVREAIGHKWPAGSGPQRIAWSRKDESAAIFIAGEHAAEGTTVFTVREAGEAVSVTIPFTDRASVENAIHAWFACRALGIAPGAIAARMATLTPVAMRLEIHKGRGRTTIINDSYNADLSSLQVGLDVLAAQAQHPKHTLILSDFAEAGTPNAALYRMVARAVAARPIQRFIGIGAALSSAAPILQEALAHKSEALFYPDTDAFIAALPTLSFENEAVLLKGARSFHFERINALLNEALHRTVLSIDLGAMLQNLAVYRAQTKPGTKLMAMVKAFSYGSGSHEIAQALQGAGVDYLSVAYADEGVALREAGIALPVMVMSPDESALDRMLAYGLEPEIFSMRSLQATARIAKALGKTDYPVHIKLDTGMHRLGFDPANMPALAEALQRTPHLRVASVFSHLAAAEDAAYDGYTAGQAALFETMSTALTDSLGYAPLRHLCNSAGIARHPALHYDMVRLGLGLYGIDGSDTLGGHLQSIGTLRSTIAQIKEIPAGEGVGYGHRGAAPAARRIATISIGYADGYPRSLSSGRGSVLIAGQRAPTVGVVCMDMCMVDVTHISEATEGTEVLIFGEGLPLTELAAAADTIPYEIMTGISARVKRVYVGE